MQRRKKSNHSTGSHGSMDSQPDKQLDHDYITIEVYIKKYEQEQYDTKSTENKIKSAYKQQ